MTTVTVQFDKVTATVMTDPDPELESLLDPITQKQEIRDHQCVIDATNHG